MGQVKIFSRISKENYARLNEIRDSYGFKSVYEIMQCLVHTFLKLADPEIQEPHPSVEYEVEDMFKEFANVEAPIYEKPVRKRKRTVYEFINKSTPAYKKENKR